MIEKTWAVFSPVERHMLICRELEVHNFDIARGCSIYQL